MENIRGAVIMVLAMAGFALEDMFIKQMSGGIPTGQILLVLCAGGILTFGPFVWKDRVRVTKAALTNSALWSRNLAEMVGTMGFITAITTSPLSIASAILQANPILVTLGAALFLSEPIGWRRMSAILAGLIGVMLVIQPWDATFVPASLWAVVGVIGLSMRDLATRRIPTEIPTSLVSVTAYLALIPAGYLLMLLAGAEFVQPDGPNSWRLLAAVVIGGIAYFCIVAANRIGDVAVVAPFRYSRIVFALVIAYLAFDEMPGLLTLIGAAIIVASGVYTLLREARLRRASQSAEAAL